MAAATTRLVNLALQSFGSRTTVTDAELTANSTNEAIQANLTIENTRDSLLRMAPWDCAMRTFNLVYITSVPGTPENTSPAAALWAPGIPRPPWAYEYQYPIDCVRACWIIPASQTGFTGTPITTAVTGYSPSTWLGAPVPFKVATDEFFAATSATVVNGGSGYVLNEIITLVSGPAGSAPIGAPAQLFVAAIGAGGAITTISVLAHTFSDADVQLGGSYFNPPANPVAQLSSTGSGTGATFNLTYTSSTTSSRSPQRVILTNQQYATLVHVRQVPNPNTWDPMFQDAYVNALGADLCMALTGDKTLANMQISKANNNIIQARTADGNEGLTINDVVPDWIRSRGIDFTDQLGPYGGFDWGGLLPLYS